MAAARHRDAPVLFWVILALVALLPLPLGAVYQWSAALMACVVGVVLGVWSGRVAIGSQDVQVGARLLWPVMVPFAIAVLWVVIQALPFTPSGWHHPLWLSAADALGAPTRGAISLNPAETVHSLVRLLAYAGIFWISVQYARRAARARRVLEAVVIAGVVYAAYGIIVYLSGSETVVIFRKEVFIGDLTATFINRNTYATYAGLGLVCASGLILELAVQATAPTMPLRVKAARAAAITVEKGWPLLLAWLVLMTALVLTHSRPGFFSTVFALLALVAIVAATRVPDRGLAAITGVVCAIGLVWVVAAAAGPFLDRLLNTSLRMEERPIVYERTIDGIRDAGVFGTGFGTFEEAFRFYRTPEIRSTFDQAHNTYLENTLELGIPASVALFVSVGGLAVLCILGAVRRRRDGIYPCVGVAACILMGTHALVDFSLQIPAVAATFVLIMGAACAQCWSSRRAPDPW